MPCPAPLALSLVLLLALPQVATAKEVRVADYGIRIGVLQPGILNAITDVPGVTVGHTTLIEGQHIRTGVTAIIPQPGNLFQGKLPAAIHIGNGFGKLVGYSQVEELGNLETPIVLTNTLSAFTAADALVDYTLALPGNEQVRSVNPVVGETNDGGLNDIRGRHVTKAHVLEALASARGGPVTEGNVGAGTGTRAFGFKGGIGTASRVVEGWTVGVLVQSNFGGVLQINGAPVGVELGQGPRYAASADGSCMIVVITDAPVDARNLKRLAQRAMLGLGRTGGISSNGSGDYVIAVSTAAELRVPYDSTAPTGAPVLHNDAMTPLFMAAIEATEEAILNSLFAADSLEGFDGSRAEALPLDRVGEILERHRLGRAPQ